MPHYSCGFNEMAENILQIYLHSRTATFTNHFS